MKRIFITAGAALLVAAPVSIGVMANASFAHNASVGVPSQVAVVDDNGGQSKQVEVGDDKGGVRKHVEVGDDKGGVRKHVEVGDDDGGLR